MINLQWTPAAANCPVLILFYIMEESKITVNHSLGETKKKILLVEDESILAMIETRMLKNVGYDVEIVRSGEEAIDTISKDKTKDLILMDVDLGPGINGMEAAGVIIKQCNTPIVFLTSHDPEMINLPGSSSGYGYIRKTWDYLSLQSSVEMAFNLMEDRGKISADHYIGSDLILYK
jgi:CheY-like chemotaxis protein